MLYISLRQYEYVCAIGRSGSLSAAAQQLNVSQPALSTALTRVESHLGYPLFSRKRGAAMALTPQGRRFIEDAEILLANAARLEGADQISANKTQLRLGCFVDLAPFILAKALRHLRAALPDLTIIYKVDGFEGLISDLVDGRVDLALTYGLSMDAGFQQQILFPSRPNAIMSPDHPLVRNSSVSLSELAAYPLILSNEGLSAQHVLGLFRQLGLNPTVAHRAASLEIQRSLAAHHEGVAVSYANPPSAHSYDGMPLNSCPVRDDIAAEPVVVARHGTGPTDPDTAQAEQTLMKLFS
ncbi:LysR family transcriptional regulator [Ruegeria sp. R14_0]|uniref:LysR family transcriptional regulator n=1 Tax=Ruegeria sp. R14_0 TaxID=2821100 RepID=UPI001ADADAB6|nr:LysR family transcriptional regulator [Ruegeria sp. R14_0]MBO9444246.1 LysR family transcriptional regulator [Ruegeria sp. R14_0]